MLQSIQLSNLLPCVFAGQSSEESTSDVWQKELVFLRGESYQIEAASGRGKTSLVSFLYGLRRDYSGQLLWNDEQGKPLNLLDDKILVEVRRRSIAILFQDLRLFPELTSMQNILLKNRLTNFTTEAEIRSQLQQLGLSERIDTPCGQMSLGEQQRVAFVRMMCQPADFCLLDEPVSHLDATNGQIMSSLLRDWQRLTGCGIIVTSIGHHLPYDYQHRLHL